MKLLDYQKIITQVLQETFDERECNNIFKYVVEEYYSNKFNMIKNYSIIDDEMEDLNVIFEKVSNHYPIQYIFQKAYFYDSVFYVDERVLIPRPETEELVHLILNENSDDNLNVLDIGTGSGCIPIILKKHRNNWAVFAIDISKNAIEVAQKNAALNDVQIQFLEMDILATPIIDQKFDIIISNPPYIPIEQKRLMSESAVLHEPSEALFVSNQNPLEFYQSILDFSKNHLSENGKLYFEINEFFASETYDLLINLPFSSVNLLKDLSGRYRMISAVR